ncbi:MAG: hypothetical protein Q8Q58_09565 [Candidatus Rokubacteria bacterium]|nr:hypothetical protein [Candidatus Rokubacteria bacterium]
MRARLLALPRLTLRGLADFEVLARHTRLRIERYRLLRPVPSR